MDVAKAGTHMLVTRGAYAEYGVEGVFLVASDFSPMQKLIEYLDENEDQKSMFRFDGRSFLVFLLAHGLLYPVNKSTLHLGEDYGDYKSVEFISNNQ